MKRSERSSLGNGSRGWWASFVDGLASLADLCAPAPPIRYPHANEAEALRSDWLRIGRDMHRVFDRHHVQTAAAHEPARD
jgi:hypothetical protein